MDKQVIGFFRVIIVMSVVYFFNIDIADTHGLKMDLADWIYGDSSGEYRNKGLIQFIMFIILWISSFYILQTIIFIFIGGALNDRNTSIFNFLRHVFKAFGEISRSKNFWTSDSGGNHNLDQIENIMKYRDNKMALMSNSDAAELLRETSTLDHVYRNRNLPQHKKTLSYMNNKMALMSNEQALEYLKKK